MANGTDVNAGLGTLGAADQAQLAQATPTPQAPAPIAGTDAMASAAQQAPIGGVPRAQAAPPAAPTPRPGSFGWKLRQVLGGVKEAMDSLGDTGNIGKAPAGAGPLYGVGKTLEARTARLQAQKEYQDKQALQQREQARLDETQRMEQEKTKAYLANEAVETYKNQLVTWALGDQQVEDGTKLGKQIFDQFATPPGGGAPARVYATDLSANEVAARARQLGKENGWNPTQQHIFPTGVEQVAAGRDAQGNPILRKRPTYSIVGDSPQMDLSNSEETRQELADILYPGVKDNVDQIPMKLSGRELGQLYTRAAATLTQNTALSTVRSNAQMGELQADAKSEFLKHSTDLNSALAEALDKNKDEVPKPEDYLLAAQKLQHDGKWADAVAKTRIALFSSGADDPFGFKGEEQYREKIFAEQQKDPFWKTLNDPAGLTPTRLSGTIANIDGLLKNETDPVKIKQLHDRRAVAAAAQSNIDAEKLKQSKEAEAAKSGDPKAYAALLVDGTVTYDELKTRFNQAELSQAAQEAVNMTGGPSNPNHWNAPQWDAYKRAAGAQQVAGYFGVTRSLLEKGGLLDQLVEAGKTIPNNKMPVINTVADLYKYHTGDPEIQAYVNKAVGVVDDYGKVMAGTAGSDAARALVTTLFKPELNQDQRVVGVDASRDTIRSQQNSRVGPNPYLKAYIRYGESVVPPNSKKVFANAADKQANKNPIGYVGPDGTYYAF